VLPLDVQSLSHRKHEWSSLDIAATAHSLEPTFASTLSVLAFGWGALGQQAGVLEAVMESRKLRDHGMRDKNQARRLTKHIDHELREFLRVGRLIQSRQYRGSELDGPLAKLSLHTSASSARSSTCSGCLASTPTPKLPSIVGRHLIERCVFAGACSTPTSSRPISAPGRLVLRGRRSNGVRGKTPACFFPRFASSSDRPNRLVTDSPKLPRS